MTLGRFVAVLVVVGAMPFIAETKEKKPRPAPPSACVLAKVGETAAICATDLIWVFQSGSYSTLSGVLHNGANYSIGDVSLIFSLYGQNDDILGTASAYLNAPLASGATWRFEASIYSSDALYTNLAVVECNVDNDARGSRRARSELRFTPPVFDSIRRLDVRRWRKAHGM